MRSQMLVGVMLVFIGVLGWIFVRTQSTMDEKEERIPQAVGQVPDGAYEPNPGVIVHSQLLPTNNNPRWEIAIYFECPNGPDLNGCQKHQFISPEAEGRIEDFWKKALTIRQNLQRADVSAREVEKGYNEIFILSGEFEEYLQQVDVKTSDGVRKLQRNEIFEIVKQINEKSLSVSRG